MWLAVRADPAMLHYYQKRCLKGNAKKSNCKSYQKATE